MQVYLAQRLQFGFHDEFELAKLTAASVGALDPLLQTILVHKAQAACAVARCDQLTVLIPLAMTDPAYKRKEEGLHTYCSIQTHSRAPACTQGFYQMERFKRCTKR